MSHYITSPASLSRLRYQAKKRGLKIRADGTGNFTVICTRTEPPRPLVGADHIPLWVAEQIVLTPLPEPPPRRKRMARLAPTIATADPIQTTAPVETAPPAHGQAHHSFLSLVEALRTRGGVL
jgi:hypothetical protein